MKRENCPAFDKTRNVVVWGTSLELRLDGAQQGNAHQGPALQGAQQGAQLGAHQGAQLGVQQDA